MIIVPSSSLLDLRLAEAVRADEDAERRRRRLVLQALLGIGITTIMLIHSCYNILSYSILEVQLTHNTQYNFQYNNIT